MGKNTQVTFVLPTEKAQLLFKICSEAAKSLMVIMFRFSIDEHSYFHHGCIHWDRKRNPEVAEIFNFIVDLELKSTDFQSKSFCYVELGENNDDVTFIGDISKFDIIYQKIIILPVIDEIRHWKINNYDQIMEAA